MRLGELVFFRVESRLCLVAAMAPSATETAIREALKRVHGPYKNNVNTVVDPLVTYYVGRGGVAG